MNKHVYMALQYAERKAVDSGHYDAFWEELHRFVKHKLRVAKESKYGKKEWREG